MPARGSEATRIQGDPPSGHEPAKENAAGIHACFLHRESSMSISIVSKHAALAAGVFGLAVAIASAPASAQRKSAQEQRKEQVAQIPTCAKPLGSISVIEPED